MSRQAIKKHSSELPTKIYLRKMAVELIQKDSVKILDCFHAEGQLWSTIQQEIQKKITVIGIEKEKQKKSKHFVFYGDNTKIISNLDLSTYDIIDLDAYGSCWKQLKQVIANKSLHSETIIIYTQIVSGMGAMEHGIFQEIGVHKIIKKCMTILSPKTRQQEFLHAALHQIGIKKVYEYQKNTIGSSKLYGFFFVQNIDNNENCAIIR